VNNGVCNNTYQLPTNIPNSTLTNINLIFYQPNVYAGSCGSQTVTLASNASSSSLGLSYQWKRDGNLISGATSSSYSTTVTGAYSLDFTPPGCSKTFNLGTQYFSQTLPTPTLTLVHPMTPPSTPASALMCDAILKVGNFQGGVPKIYYRLVGNSAWILYSTLLEVPQITNYEFKVDNTTLGACPVTTSNIIPGLPPYHATITPSSGTACAGSSVLLTANPTFPGTMMYQWKYYGTDIPGATSPTYAATQSGNYTVVTSNGPCSYTSAASSVTINPASYEIYKYATFSGACGNQTVTLQSLQTFPPGGAFQWKLNGTAVSGATNSTYTTNVVGSYTVAYTPSGCPQTTSAPFIFTQATPTAPVTSYNPAIAPACVPTVSCTPCAGSAIEVLERDIGSGFSGISTQNPYPIFSQGAWQYRYRCENGACLSPSINSNVVIGFPNLYTQVVPGSSSVCAGALLNASSATSGLSYQWIKDGSDIFGATSINYSVTQSGAYAVRVTKGACTYTSVASTITLTSTFPTISSNITGTCASPSVQMVSNLTSGTFQWKRDGVAISGATSDSYITTVEGIYTYDNTYSGCSATSFPYNFYVNTVPIITLSPPVAPSCSQTLTATKCSSGYIYWDQNLGSGWAAYTTSFGSSIQVPDVVATYRARCTTPDLISPCVSPYSNVIAANAYLFTEITSIRNYICGIGPIPVLLTATSTYTGMTYQWKKNGVDISGATSATYSASTAGDYTVVVTKNGCTYTSVLKSISLFTPQILPINASFTGACGNQTATMVTTVFPMTLYVWKRNGVVVAGETANTLVTTIAGSYTVETAGFDADCSNQSVPYPFTQVGSAPTVVFNAVSPPVCSAFLSSTGCGGQTRWYKQDNANNWVFDGFGTPYYPSTNTLTQFRATCLVNTCETNPSNVVTFTPNLFTQIAPNPATICPGGSTELSAVSTFSGLNYQWMLNGNNIVGATNATFTATQTGSYSLLVNNSPAAACFFTTAPLVIGAGVSLTISSLASGNWNVAATWSCNCIPTPCDNVTVETGHTVTIPVSQTGKLRNLIVKGLVDMKSPSAMKLK
jgi:large repetitive protein